jgi:hypothetical protein
MRIVQMSDLHVGERLFRPELRMQAGPTAAYTFPDPVLPRAWTILTACPRQPQAMARGGPTQSVKHGAWRGRSNELERSSGRA